MRIHASRLITGTGEAPLRDAVVTVDDERIVGIGSLSDNQGRIDHAYPTGTLIPGLIDAHCHLTLTGDRRTYEQMTQDTDEMMALTSVRNLTRHLKSGVTTLRDNGGRNQVTFEVRRAAQRGYFEFPRMLLAGRPITHSFGHFYWCNGVADGEDEIRAAVRRLVAEGADHIKIMASGGGTAGNIPYYASYTAAELRAAVDAAHALGRLTTAHCRAAESIANALDAGLDCVEHAEFLVPGEITEYGAGVAPSGAMEYNADLARRLIESGTFIGFTAQAGGYHSLLDLRAGHEGAAGPGALELLERQLEMKLEILSSLLRDGALPRLVISSDAGPFDVPFGRLSDGLRLAVQAGMTPIQAIVSATRTAAEACGIAAVVGTIEVGKYADLVIVEGDPGADIECLRDVRAVFLSGRLVGA